MNSLDYVVLLLGISVIVCFLILLAKGKKITMNKKIRYYPLLLVVITIISTLYLSHYSENQINKLVNRFNFLTNKENPYSYDSLSFTKDRKDEIIDSLKRINKEYLEILQNLKKQEKIVGNKSNVIPNVEKAIDKTKQEIYKIETYNEIINDSIYSNKMKGYITKGDAPNFRFQPPSDINNDYLDFTIKFNDESMLSEIVIYIDVVKIKDNENRLLLFDQYYKPQKGVNAFRVRNYLKDNKTQISIGYFFISEIGRKEYPTYYRVVYSLN